MQLKVLVNNMISDPRYKYGWGLSIFVDGLGEGLLFDTGPDGATLLENMKLAGVKPDDIKHIVISHIHLDHIGGLIDLLDEMSHSPTVYIPAYIAKEFADRIKRHGGKVERISDVTQIFNGVYSSGQLGVVLVEQALVIKSPKGLVILTGCSHPKVTSIVSHVRGAFLDQHIYLVLGGFHLLEKDRDYITETMKYLKVIGVEKISPSHCSGETAIQIAKEVFGEDNYIDSGAGAVINIE